MTHAEKILRLAEEHHLKMSVLSFCSSKTGFRGLQMSLNEKINNTPRSTINPTRSLIAKSLHFAIVIHDVQYLC
jgi:hypothetical protein